MRNSDNISELLKNWVMVLLSLAFVLLYGMALIGKISPLADVSIVARLEPIIFVIIGYYFGRLPSQQTEQTLKEGIRLETEKTDDAQKAERQALQSRATLEAKLKSVTAALSSISPNASLNVLTENLVNKEDAHPDQLRHSVAAALNILNRS